MKIINFDDDYNKEQWLEWRKNGITSTDISVIMGNNPYTTPLQLWEKKCGYREESPMNAAMEHGIQTEERARQWLNAHLQLNLKPVCIEDTSDSIFRASLDGFDFDQKVLVEIKCPVSEKTLDRARNSQAIHDYWMDQVQWAIGISKPIKTILAMWDYRYESCICLDILGDPKYFEEMTVKAKEFWHNLQLGKAPKPGKGDFLSLEDDTLHEMLLEYQGINDEEKVLSNRRKELKKEIENFGDGNSFIAYGFKVTKSSPSVTYDIEKMRLDGIPVEKYIKKSNSNGYFRINIPSN